MKECHLILPLTDGFLQETLSGTCVQGQDLAFFTGSNPQSLLPPQLLSQLFLPTQKLLILQVVGWQQGVNWLWQS